MRTMIKSIVAGALIALGMLAVAHADTLDDIKARGVIRVGVKADAYPFGFLNPSGKVEGAEILISEALAQKLNVKLETVIVTSANRIEFLQQGKVDILVANLAETPERRRVVDLLDPLYFYSATNVLALKSKKLTAWTQLKDQTLCGGQGSVFNKWVEQTYGAKTMTFPTIEEALTALRSGTCVGFVFTDSILRMALRKPEWKDYETPLPPQLPQRHAIGVRKGEGAAPLGKFLSSTLTEWIQNGKLISFYAAYGIPVDKYFEDAARPAKSN